MIGTRTLATKPVSKWNAVLAGKYVAPYGWEIGKNIGDEAIVQLMGGWILEVRPSQTWSFSVSGYGGQLIQPVCVRRGMGIKCINIPHHV